MSDAVLIASLGDSPGAVTTSIDLLHSVEQVQIAKLVVLMPPRAETAGGVGCETVSDRWLPAPQLHCDEKPRRRAYCDYIAPELSGSPKRASYYERELGWPKAIEAVARVVNIANDDIKCQPQALEFFRLCLREILAHKDTHDVYVGIAGGRTSMSSLLLTAALLAGVGGNAFCAVVPSGLARDAEQLADASPEERDRSLHPGDSAWHLPVGLPLSETMVEDELTEWARLAVEEPGVAFGTAGPSDPASWDAVRDVAKIRGRKYE